MGRRVSFRGEWKAETGVYFVTHNRTLCAAQKNTNRSRLPAWTWTQGLRKLWSIYKGSGFVSNSTQSSLTISSGSISTTRKKTQHEACDGKLIELGSEKKSYIVSDLLCLNRFLPSYWSLLPSLWPPQWKPKLPRQLMARLTIWSERNFCWRNC